MTKKKSKPVDSTMRNVKAANRRFEELDKKIDDTQAWLIALASACWQVCGTDYAKQMADALCKSKKRAKK